MRQAIVTKYFGPTNSRGSRIKATADGGSVTVPYDHAISLEANHRAAGMALAKKLGWGGEWHGGSLPGRSTGYVFINASSTDTWAF